MKRKYLYTMMGFGGSAALLLSGPSLANPPTGHAFNDWTAAAGIITKTTCTPPACVVLLNETGMTQVRVQDTGGTGYFQTINVEDTYTGPALAAAFRSETFVGSTDQTNNFDMANLTFVDLSGEGISQVEIASGALQDTGANEAALDIYQTNTLTGYGTAEFWFARQTLGGAQFSTATNAGGSLRIDQEVNNVGGDRGTPITIRKTSGFYTSGPGVLSTIDSQTIAYANGDNIGTVYMSGQLWHLGPMHAPGNDQRAFVLQNIDNFTTAQSASFVSDNNTIDDEGIGFVNFVAPGTLPWDANFGATPTILAAPPTNFAVLNAPAAFPSFPDHTP